MFHLLKNTYLDVQGTSNPSGYKVISTDSFSVADVAGLKSNDRIVYSVPKFTFSKIVIEYIKELFAAAPPALVIEIYNLVMARMTYQLAYLTDNQTRNAYIDCNLPSSTVNIIVEVTKYRGLFEGDFKRHVGIEWLLCDYFNDGIYSDEFQKRFRELLIKNVVYSVQDIKHEMLYKVFNLPKMYLNYDTVEELFSKDVGVQFLFDPNLNNPNHLMTKYKIEDIADLFHTFTKLYNKGFDRAKYQEMTVQSLFLHKASACLKSGNCDQMMREDLQRDFSIIFGHRRFIRKMNCLLIEWIYQQKREKKPNFESLNL